MEQNFWKMYQTYLRLFNIEFDLRKTLNKVRKVVNEAPISINLFFQSIIPWKKSVWALPEWRGWATGRDLARRSGSSRRSPCWPLRSCRECRAPPWTHRAPSRLASPRSPRGLQGRSALKRGRACPRPTPAARRTAWNHGAARNMARGTWPPSPAGGGRRASGGRCEKACSGGRACCERRRMSPNRGARGAVGWWRLGRRWRSDWGPEGRRGELRAEEGDDWEIRKLASVDTTLNGRSPPCPVGWPSLNNPRFFDIS